MNVGKLIGLHLPAILLLFAAMLPAMAFETGVPLSFAIDPATIRQRADSQTAKVEAVVTLKAPSPAFFVCQIRSADGGQISFPTIIFRKGDTKGKSDGVVHWKAVKHDTRVRLSAYNADSPEMQLTFTVALKPEAEADTGEGGAGN